MKRNNKDKIVLTGICENDLKGDLHLLDKGYNVPRLCYLCKRQEGNKSVALHYGGKEPSISLPELKFEYITRVIKVTNGKRLEFNFPVCHECRILMKSI